ncbi:MAG: hypothetical protein AB198_02220 [Parcubacteria bacterium C7867-003]|nr:MAG: hypothetical protein AB198_02220 [Parcubacteria bacterium C7867-003]
MNFLLKSKPKRNYDIKIIIVIMVFVLLAGASFVFPTFFRSASYFVMKPFWFLRDKTAYSTSFITNFFSFKSSLIKENARLKEELALLNLNKIDYDVLVKENEDLKSQFGKISGSNIIFSNILSKPPQSPHDTFVINSGSSSGVSIGDKVYISDRIIVGNVSSVTENNSVVKLFSTGGEKVEVSLFRTGASFVISGIGGADFQLEVPKETDIVWGDSFIYPGSKDSIISTVYYVDANSQSSFKTIYSRIPGNVFQSKIVFIEK